MVLCCPYCERKLNSVGLHYAGPPIAEDKVNMVKLYLVNHSLSPGRCEELFLIAEDTSGDRKDEDRFLVCFKRPEHWNPPT
jgi:hypothetical protein